MPDISRKSGAADGFVGSWRHTALVRREKEPDTEI